MKYIILLAFLFVSCESTYVNLSQPSSVNTSVVDFKKYNDLGFTYSLASPTGTYESKGVVSVSIDPEIIVTTFSEADPGDIIKKEIDGEKLSFLVQVNKYRDGTGNIINSYFGVQLIELESALDTLYHEAVKIGANSVYDLDYEYRQSNKGDLIVHTLSASGLAVYKNESP